MKDISRKHALQIQAALCVKSRGLAKQSTFWAAPNVGYIRKRLTIEPGMIKCLQLNLNHCEAAQDLLNQTLNEEEIDIALLSEPYRIKTDSNRWASDANDNAAIMNCGNYSFEIQPQKYNGFVIAKIKGIFFCSCYISPNCSMNDFEQTVDVLTGVIRGKAPIVVAGDFNAWATEWGCSVTTQRGAALLE